MLLGIMSDVHCNARAMQRALDELSGTVDDVLLAGDAVLQYRFSNEVIESIRHHGITYVVGNHELTLLSQDGERARSASGVRRHNVEFMAESPTQHERQVSAGSRRTQIKPGFPQSVFLARTIRRVIRRISSRVATTALTSWRISPGSRARTA